MAKQVIDIDLSLRITTDNKDKMDWVLESLFGLLVHDQEITKVGLNVKK